MNMHGDFSDYHGALMAFVRDHRGGGAWFVFRSCLFISVLHAEDG